MWIPDNRNNNKIINALFIGVCCGIVGILPDIDHIVSYWLSPLSEDRRIFHVAIFIVCCIVLFSLISYGTGFFIQRILKKKDEKLF